MFAQQTQFEAKKEMRKLGYDENTISYASSRIPLEDEELIAAREEYDKLYEKYAEERREEHDKVIELGGLHIIGTERHESRRIDNQLRGRAGRQGDPGSTRFFVGLDDDLIRLFGGERIQVMMQKLASSGDEAIESKMLTKTIENAQKKVEGRNFTSRKYVLQYDNVMNKQREIIYSETGKICGLTFCPWPRNLRMKRWRRVLRSPSSPRNGICQLSRRR